MNLYLRKNDCAICGQLVVSDLDDGTITCDCNQTFIPQWVLIDAWQRRNWLKNFTKTNPEEIDRLKQQRRSQAGT